MKTNRRQRAFIVVEGINGAGKSTTLDSVLTIISAGDLVYSRGFTQSSFLDSCLHEHPHSLTYYLDLVWKTRSIITPNIQQGKTVLQDRYVQTVDSFLPDCEHLHNRILRRLLAPLFLCPDLYVEITASTDEIVRRLQCRTDVYSQDIRNNPDCINRRKAKYREIYNSLDCAKQIIDTTGRKPEESALNFIDIVRRELECW